MAIYSENGWILPDGKFIECNYKQHIACARKKLGMEEEDLEKIAVKISCMPVPRQVVFFGKKEYHPLFATMRREMTKQQLRTIEEYCVTFGYRPPPDYFLQQGLLSMSEMSTEDILSILEKK